MEKLEKNSKEQEEKKIETEKSETENQSSLDMNEHSSTITFHHDPIKD